MAENSIKRFWNETYRPSTLDEYIFQSDQHKEQFTKMINDREITHLLLSGPPGSGKTSISQLLVKLLDISSMDILRINASDETSVDVMRDKVKSFVQTYALSKFKVVQLEECDRLSIAAQDSLKFITEEFSDNARFISTCNHVNKVIPALRSRFTHFEFKSLKRDEAVLRLGEILTIENINFDMEMLSFFIDAAYPDMRKIINLAQQYSSTGTLVRPTISDAGDYKIKILDLLSKNDFRGIRKVVCENAAREDYEDLYRFMYDNISKVEQFASNTTLHEHAIVMIANYLYKNGIIADQEIGFAAMCCELGTLKG